MNRALEIALAERETAQHRVAGHNTGVDLTMVQIEKGIERTVRKGEQHGRSE